MTDDKQDFLDAENPLESIFDSKNLETTLEKSNGSDQTTEEDNPILSLSDPADTSTTSEETTTFQEQTTNADKIAQLEKQVDESKDQALRSLAEVENVRRRARLDVEKAHKYGNENIIQHLLPVIDSLEQSIATLDTEDEKLKVVKEGLDITLKLFLDSLKKINLVTLDPQDEAFDPACHEALSMIPSDEIPANNILQVIQKGYQLADRIIRPAKVIVSKGKEQATASSSEIEST